MGAAKKDALWFPHDSNARLDEKMVTLKNEFGMAGYGLWWTVIEILREKSDYRYPINKPWQYSALLSQLSDQTVDTQDFLDTCVKIGLLRRTRYYIWSESLCRRMSLWDAKKKKLSEAGKKGMRVRYGDKEDKTPVKPRFTEDNQDTNEVITSPVTDVITITEQNTNNTKNIKDKTYVDDQENKPDTEPDKTTNKPTDGLNKDEPATKISKTTIPAQAIVDLWNAITKDQLPRVERLTAQRRGKIKVRCTENTTDLEWWDAYFRRIVASEWCTGGPDGTGWRATFDWSVRSADVVAKVLEGVYDNRKGKKDGDKGKNPWKH